MSKKINNRLKLSSIPSKSMPLDIGVIHFVGIGGIGMSGIAEILKNLGYDVSGSDLSENYNVKRLRNMGIDVKIGHRAENVEKVAVVVKSTAVPLTNPEIVAAKERQIPVVRRSEMLAELTHLKATVAVAGSHGKTTTTSIVARIFEEAELDPTVINGGIINAYGTNAHLGDSDWLIAEADESDGTFIKIPSTIGIITNIDPEHLDYWGSYQKLKDAFKTFIENLPFYGFAVLCYDNSEVKEIAGYVNDRRIVSYGVEDEDADIRAVNINYKSDGTSFDVEISERLSSDGPKSLKNVFISTPGLHNVKNSLAAIAVALELNIENAKILSALKNFSGVKRRFTKTGEVDGITIIDDYGHHPTEIEVTLNTARKVVDNSDISDGKVIAVVQPHRYSRLEKLFSEFCNCFGSADKVVVLDVYSAGEKPIKGVDSAALVDGLTRNNIDAIELSKSDDLVKTINEFAGEGDIVVCLGAGSITLMAGSLPMELKQIKDGREAV